MAGESVTGGREPLDQARLLLKSATQRTRVAADPRAKPATRLRAARAAKAALTRVLAQALDHQGTDQERDRWTLHRAAEELFGTADRQVDRLATPPLPRKGPPRSPKAAGSTAKRGKLSPLDKSLEARHERQQVAQKRYSSSLRPIRTVSAGLPSLGRR